jgi:hypothetical protein
MGSHTVHTFDTWTDCFKAWWWLNVEPKHVVMTYVNTCQVLHIVVFKTVLKYTIVQYIAFIVKFSDF